MKKKGEMLEVGKIREGWGARFTRLQRRAHLVAPRMGWPKGVQRFRTWEELESWERTRRAN